MNEKFTRHNQSPLIGALWIKRLFRFFIHQDAVRLVLATFFLFSAMAVSAAPIGTITTAAGNRVQGYNGDGIPATSANLSGPSNSMAVDSLGNLYFADEYNNRVRKVDAGTGIISTVAGNGGPSTYTGNGGLATAVSLGNPTAVVMDGLGNLYISANYRIHKVNAETGIISVVAGNENAISSGRLGDGGGGIVGRFGFTERHSDR